MKIVHKRGNHYYIPKSDKRKANQSIADMVRARREQALAVVVTVPPGTAGKVKQ
jgi:arginine repressor